LTVEIVFETHSFTTDNENGIATGWHDGELSERGRTLAVAVGERNRHGVSAVFCSDLARARETAEIAFRGSGTPVDFDARLRECNDGDWNGMPVAKLEAQRAQHVDTPFPGGESYTDVVDRMAVFLTEVARDWDGHRIVVIGHTATRWALDHLLNGETLRHVVMAPFQWQEGWLYLLPTGWRREVAMLTFPAADQAARSAAM
jgi:alpha-ribazole phosphatase/probable phosphoglycerate mutase